jgi:hypothetical protein
MVTVKGSSQAVMRINSGGSAYTTTDNRPFSVDAAYSADSPYVLPSSTDTPNTTDDVLYRSERWGTFGYTFRVPPAPTT